MQENSKDEDDKAAVDWVLKGRRCIIRAAMLVDLRSAVRHQVARPAVKIFQQYDSLG